MLEKINLQPVNALPLDFNPSLQWVRDRKQPTVKDHAEKAANQSFLTFEQTEDGKISYVLRGHGMDILYQERDKKTLISEYQERLMFWLERSVRNSIVNIKTGKFQVTDPEYLGRCEDFYRAVFIENRPTDILLHRMLDADQIDKHNHALHDTSLTLNVSSLL